MAVTNRSEKETPTAQLANFRQQAVRAIRAAIVSGEIEPGQLYPVGYFADQLGVSSTPVRDALFDLAHQGLVTVLRNRGFQVVELSDHDLDEIFELRQMIEIPATALAAGRLTSEDVGVCRALVRQIEGAAQSGNVTDFLDADREFHLQLLSVGGNRRLVEIVARLRDQTRLYNAYDLASSGGLIESAREHENILGAIVDGDTAATERLMERHLEHTRGLWMGPTEPAYPESQTPGSAPSRGAHGDTIPLGHATHGGRDEDSR